MKNIFRSEKVRWFLPILYKDINLLVVSLIIGLISCGVGLSLAVFSQKMIDDIIPSKDTHYFYKAIGVLVILLLLRIATMYLQPLVGSIHGKRFNLRLVNAFFAKMIFLPKSFFDEHKTGTLITRMHDSAAIHGTVMFVFNALILNFLNILISAIFLFQYSVLIGLIALASFPLFFISSLIHKGLMKIRLQEMYVANGENESNYISSIQNIDLIKTHNKQTYYTEQNAVKYGNSLEKGFRAHLTGMNFGLSSDSIGTLCYLLILSIAAYQALVGHITVGEFTATLGVATGMLGPIGVLGNALMHLQEARVAFDRMYEILSAKSEFNIDEEVRKDFPGRIHHIGLDDVSFSYDTNIPLLKNINFSASSGEIVCIFGRNGSGKSTLINLLVALYHPVSGRILVNGKSILDYSIVGIRNQIAVVSQQTKLFDGSLMYNVCMSTDQHEIKKACEFLSARGFDPFIARIQGGYEAQVSEDGNNLSGGQKQIIALARALYKYPDVLLVDEATAALDSESEEFVIKSLQEFADQGGIVIMVSHRLNPARASSRIIVLDEYSVQAEGDHDSLMLTRNLYSRRYKVSEKRQKSPAVTTE